jgi:hypothetical protein
MVFLAALAALAAIPARRASAADAEVLRKGGVSFYRKQKRIEINGAFCLEEGPIELLACAEGGKEYESVITLNVTPSVLHLCLIVMGLKPGETGPRFQGDPDRAPTGSPVIVKVRWKDGDKRRTVRAENLCWNIIDKRTMAKTPWVFVGSRIQKDPDTGRRTYWADVEKSVITVFRDPYSVLDLPLALGANDEAYVVNKRIVPKKGTACTVILEPGPKSEPPAKNPEGGRVIHVDVTAGGRVLFNTHEAMKPAGALRTIAWYDPAASCRVTVDHAPVAGPAAKAMQAVAAAGLTIDSVEMTRVRPEVGDAATLVVKDGSVTIRGKAVSEEQAKLVLRALLRKKKGAGVKIVVEAGAGPGAVASALRACAAADECPPRIVWNAKRVKGDPGVRPEPMGSVPAGEGGGSILPVKVGAAGVVTVAGRKSDDMGGMLRSICWYEPQTMCRLIVAHGAPPRAIAEAFDAVWTSGLALESARMSGARPDVEHAVTLEINGHRILHGGDELTQKKVSKLVQNAIEGEQKIGVKMVLDSSSFPRTVARAAEACAGLPQVVMQLEWRKEE